MLTPTTAIPSTLAQVEPTEYVAPGDAAILSSRGGLPMPRLLPIWWTQTRRFAIAPEGEPDFLEYAWEDANGDSLPNGTGQDVQLAITRSRYDPSRVPDGQIIHGVARDYLTSWTEGVCPKLDEGNAEQPALQWHDTTYQYALSAQPQPGCFSNFNDLGDLVKVADSLVLCGKTGGAFACDAG